MAIYVEELCGGKQFSQEQWARLVPRVRAMAGEGYTGEGELFTMMRAKNAALNITNLGQCWTAEAVAMRELFEIELSPAL